MEVKDLIIVESPTKAETIRKILKNKYEVIASKGHIKDLPKRKLGIDLSNSFEPTFIIIRGKEKIIKELKKTAEKAKRIYLGCDPDREGEAIAYHIFSIINKNHKDIKRILIYEITKEGIEKALASPQEIDMNKIASHKARRVVDRLVGYLVSPLLWKIFGKKNLSAGRVQTVALRILCEREKEIEEFIPEEYWLIFGNFEKEDRKLIKGLLKKIDDKEIEIKNEKEAEEISKEIKKIEQFFIKEKKEKLKYYEPPPPFITATLQQEAAKILGFSSKKTMVIAQRLFEGIQLKDEMVGLITYPRTDSFRINDDFLKNIRNYIVENYGEEYLNKEIRRFKEKKFTQGAHEAIRPTDLKRNPELIKEYLTKDEYELYRLIYLRTLATQMVPAIYKEVKVEICGIKDKVYSFESEGLLKVFEGYEKIYYEERKEKLIAKVKEGEVLKLKELIKEQHFTQPPPRYTEATLIKKLEKHGIGRPSTYAVIVSTLFERKYVKKEKKTLYPTELGKLVNEILIPRFPDIFNINFTKLMEENLDKIEEGEEEWIRVVEKFYEPFNKDLINFEKNIEDLKKEILKELDEDCPICGKRLKIRYGRYGKFIACLDYPECSYVKKDLNYLDENCPLCGKKLVYRKSRFGDFVACSGFPHCNYIKKDDINNNS
ncbi:MAG: type I DNA topoisomerase [candidate division WOR-3 bacterium]|nr:type I DNA topoisomerase [candidate division WOR-3 bacterium]MCX7837369.1 type I DNA topoisomerase [candidate division WOR-3 bacterium]MDW8114112.1 type I DNA topoisomerase [candidate division WOR-3 bacterium]